MQVSKTFYWILLCPCLTLNVGIATAGEGPIDHSLAAQYCISGKQNYKVIQPYFSKHNHEKLLNFNNLQTLSLSHARERDVPGQEKNNGYMEPIHITNPCRNFSDSFAIKSSLRNCSVVFSTEFSYNNRCSGAQFTIHVRSHHPGKTYICRKI